MKLKRLKIKNIRSYEEQEITFPDGSCLLAGDIGAGKTTILLAIEYALFGLQPGQKGASLLRNGCDSGEVELDFEIDGNLITLERGLKRTIRGISNEYAAITIGSERMESSVTEIKSRVIELLGYPPEFVKRNNTLYRFTIYTPQEQMKQIIQEDPESRRDILRQVFGIEKYRLIRSNLSLLISYLKGESKLLLGEVNTIEQDIEIAKQYREHLQEIELKIKSQEKELAEKRSLRLENESQLKILQEKIDERRTFERELEKTKLVLSSKQEQFASISRQISDLLQNIQDAGEPFNQSEYDSLIQELQAKQQEKDALNESLLSCSSKLRSLELEQDEISKKKERIFKIDICPTCLQDVKETHKHNILNETDTRITKIKREIVELQQNQRIISEKRESLRKFLESLTNKKIALEVRRSKQIFLETAGKKVEQLEKQKESIRNDQHFLESHFTSLKETLLRYSPYEIKHKQQLEIVNKSLNEERDAEITLAEKNKEREMTQRHISRLEDIIAGKEVSKQKLYQLQNQIEWLSSQFLNLIEFTERNVLLKLRNEFSRIFKKWFLMLVTENSFDARIDDTFTPIILQGETEMDYEFLSGGERTAVALAYRLALNQTVNSVLSTIKTPGLIILDEPTDGFSEAQIMKLREILDELKSDQLIIVSHEQKIEGFVDQILKVSKNNDLSEVATCSDSLVKISPSN